MIESPVFLVGSERSGTTLLRLMLDHHPKIAFEYEFEYAVDWEGGEDWPDLPGYYERLSMHRIYLSRGYPIDRGLSYPRLVDDFLVQRRTMAGKPIVGATVHHCFDRLPKIWPRARYIHLLRDGRDVSRSVIQMGWAGNMWTAAATWEEAELAWGAMRPLLSADQFVEANYEELVQRPEETLERLCRFIGVAYDPAMMTYPEESSYGRPDPDLIYQWRKKLSAEEVRLAEARIGALLVQRGYVPSGLPPLVVTESMKRDLQRQCSRYRRKHRIKKFGILNCAADAVSRRLPIRIVKRLVADRMNAIEKQDLK